MNFKFKAKKIYRASILLSLLSTVLLTLSFTLSFDKVNGYFTGGALPILFWIAYILSIALSLAAPFLLPKKEIVKTDDSLGKEKNAYMLWGGALILCAVITNLFSTSKYFTIAMGGILFFSCYLILCSRDGYKYSNFKLLCLLLSVLFPVLINMDNTMVMHRHSNSVENLLTSVFAIAFILYILYEGKRIFKGEHSKWHFSSMLLASHTGLSLSVAYFVAYCFGSVDERSRLPQLILILLISFLVQTELLRFTILAESRSQEDWDKLSSPIEEEIEE